MKHTVDNPILDPRDDKLGRAKSAILFAERALELDATAGVVVGVLGPWGSGKTSFVNLSRKFWQSAGIQVFEFNPWMLSGTEQLVDSFFAELSAQMKSSNDLAEVGETLEEFGETLSGLAWLPVVGSSIERFRVVVRFAGRVLRRRTGGINARRDRVRDALARLHKPIVVVLDDIDRLSTSEIRQIFKLVRLTASFPKIIYVLVFDRLRVERALSEGGIAGRDYLDKILQIGFDLPSVPPHLLTKQLTSAIDDVVSSIDCPGPFHQAEWPDAFIEIVRPLVGNMRDVRRYAIAARGTIQELDGKVALVDVLALEAVRVFLPDTFLRIPETVEALTETSDPDPFEVGTPDELKKPIEGLIESAKPHDEVVRALVCRVFLGAQRHVAGCQHDGADEDKWLPQRRVAHGQILRLYLERVAGPELLSFTDAEVAVARMTDLDALDGYLRSLDRGRLHEVIASLEAHEDQFDSDRAVPGTIVLLNILPDIPERPIGMFEFDDRFSVRRVVSRLLRPLEGQEEVEQAVQAILPEVTHLSSKLLLLTLVGHKKDVGHNLIPEAAANQFNRDWRAEVRCAPESALVAENGELLDVLLVAKYDASSGESVRDLSNSPSLTLEILKSARSETTSQSFDSRSIKRSAVLRWEHLLQLYGDESRLRVTVDSLRAAGLPDSGEMLRLVDRHLAGWRPNPFHDS